MRKRNVVDQANAIAISDPKSSRAPFTNPIQGYDCCLTEWTGEERTGGMAFMVVGKDQCARVDPPKPRATSDADGVCP